jgi:hypothetical protein
MLAEEGVAKFMPPPPPHATCMVELWVRLQFTDIPQRS